MSSPAAGLAPCSGAAKEKLVLLLAGASQGGGVGVSAGQSDPEKVRKSLFPA